MGRATDPRTIHSLCGCRRGGSGVVFENRLFVARCSAGTTRTEATLLIELCPCRPYCCGVLCAGFVSRALQAALPLRRIVRKPELTRPTIPRTSRSRGPTEPTQRLQNKNKQSLFKQNMNTNLPQKIVCTEYDAQYVTKSPQVWDVLPS